MPCSQLTQWVLMVSLTACSSDPRPPTAFGPGEGTTGAGGGVGGAGGTRALVSDAMTPTETGPAGGADSGPAADGPSDAPFVRSDVSVFRDDDAQAALCPNDQAALGSSTLTAGGGTPAAFATAFNADLMKLPTAGPLLLTLSGVNPGSAAPKTASLGPLTMMTGGVAFAGAHADVPYALGAGGAVTIMKSDASFALRFIAPASDAMIPVASVELTGKLGTSCVSMTISSLKLLVPATAGTMAFHGSTVGALMGTPTASAQGGSNNAWLLELTGDVIQVNALSNDDAGEMP